MPAQYRLFSWEHSYFSGKARAYLRYKERSGGLGPGYEDILSSPELATGLLIPKTGSPAVPQLEAPDGTWIQDSSEIIDFCEAAHPRPAVTPDPAASPRQCLTAYLVELLADEWLVVPGFWERWYFSEDGRELDHPLSHRIFNEQQWGAVLAPDAPGPARRRAGGAFFERAFGISESRSNPRGVYAGLVHLGCNEVTEMAWQASQHRVLGLLETHFGVHDYALGGRPSLADFGLLGPLYAHLFRDAVPGFALRVYFPLVAEWVERTNGEGCAGRPRARDAAPRARRLLRRDVARAAQHHGAAAWVHRQRRPPAGRRASGQDLLRDPGLRGSPDGRRCPDPGVRDRRRDGPQDGRALPGLDAAAHRGRAARVHRQ
jgi:glutathione S-transferase